MAAPVWILSVDLQTKTATFQTGLADAAKTAREKFKDIKDSANEMGDGVRDASGKVEYSMMEARHGVMMLGEEFGIHLPRGLTTFIASLGPVGAAMEMAFPFLAIILGATLLIEHLVKIGEEAEKAAKAGQKFDTDMAANVDKAKEAYIDAEIEVRNLAGLPAWDLLAERLKLKEADEGRENVKHLSEEMGELLNKAKATSNWNPFNWFDGSGDVANKVKQLQEQLRGPDGENKNPAEQQSILQNNLSIQSRLLESMRGQAGVSKEQLRNQQEYVGWLQKATSEITHQNDAKTLSANNQATKDRDAKIRQAEQEQAALYREQQAGANHRLQVEAEYSKKQAEINKKRVEDNERLAEEESRATEVVINAAKKAAEEQAKINEDLGKEEAEHAKKMAELSIKSDEEITKDAVKLHKSRSEAILQAEVAGENAVYQSELSGYTVQLNALDKNGKDYEVKLKQIQDREIELAKAHANKLAQIEEQAEAEKNQRLLSARTKADDVMAASAMKVLSGQETAGKALLGIGREVAAGMMENAIKSVLANNFTKESDAAAAARKAFLAGEHFPFPANIVMGPLLGAAAFASVMAFDAGGIVKGTGGVDSVPARLTPGEGVIPKRTMEGLQNAANNGSMGGSITHQTHVHNTNHFQALDSSGMSEVLEKHSDLIEQHVDRAFRRRGM